MSTTGRPESPDDATSLADRCREAAFVRVVARPDGDAIAAAGLLARACAAAGTPYQVSVAATRGAASDRLATGESDDTTLAIGFDGTPANATIGGETLSSTAFAAAREIHEPDRALALAGVRAAGDLPQDALAASADRRPGVGVPVADLADGLAHTTGLHTDWSGDDRQSGALLAELELPAELDADARRRLASRVALDATENAAPRAVGALAGVLRPHVTPDGPFETAEGYADVLDCLAVAEPGLALALTIGVADRPTALDVWREHASATHAALRTVDPARYSGVVVCEVDAPAWPLARLVRDTRADEPAALAVGADGAALATTPTGPDARETLAAAVGDDAVVGTSTHARTPKTDVDVIRTGVREVST